MVLHSKSIARGVQDTVGISMYCSSVTLERVNPGSGGKGRGIKWGDAMKRLGEQSSIRVDAAQFTEVIEALENDSGTACRCWRAR